MATPYVGEVRLVGWPRIPVGWQACDGSLLSIAEYQTLFTLIGTTYGGDGVTSFGVPDLRGRIPMHTSSTSPLGQSVGTEEVTLLATQLPAHTHAAVANATAGPVDTPANNFPAASAAASAYTTAAPTVNFATNAIGSAGSSLPHDNMMPTLTGSFIIATAGIYPSA
jgi:microcystin-dependent protein